MGHMGYRADWVNSFKVLRSCNKKLPDARPTVTGTNTVAALSISFSSLIKTYMSALMLMTMMVMATAMMLMMVTVVTTIMMMMISHLD